MVLAGSEGVVEVVADQRVTLRRDDGSRDEWRAPEPDGDPHLVPMRRWAEVVRDAVAEGVVTPDAAVKELKNRPATRAAKPGRSA